MSDPINGEDSSAGGTDIPCRPDLRHDLVIARLDTARLALREARTIQDTKQVLDVAAAAEVYARRQKLSQESIDYAYEIKIEALAQLGRMLKETPKNSGVRMAGRDTIGGTKVEPPSDAPTLADLGLDKKTSALAQKLASLPPEQFEQVRGGKESLDQALKRAKAASGETSKTERLPSPPPPPVDEAGVFFHPRAADALTNGRAEFKALINQTHAIKRSIAAIARNPLGRLIHLQSVHTDLDNVLRQLRFAAPYSSCPLMDPCTDSCKLCQGTQWIGENSYASLPPRLRRGTK